MSKVTALTAGPRPDITPPQIVAGVIAGIPLFAELLKAFGVFDLNLEQQQALSNVVTWAGVFGAALIGGDAVIRTGRNVRKGRVEAVLAEGGEGERLEIVSNVTAPESEPQPNSLPIPSNAPPSTTGFEEPKE